MACWKDLIYEKASRKFAVRLVHYTLASFTDSQDPNSQARGMRGWE